MLEYEANTTMEMPNLHDRVRGWEQRPGEGRSEVVLGSVLSALCHAPEQRNIRLAILVPVQVSGWLAAYNPLPGCC